MLYSFSSLNENVGCSSAFRLRYPNIYFRTVLFYVNIFMLLCKNITSEAYLLDLLMVSSCILKLKGGSTMFSQAQVKDFIQFCADQKSLNAKTVNAYRIDIVQFISFMNQADCNVLSKELLQNYIVHLNRCYKPRSAKRRLASVKGFLSYLKKEGTILENPFLGLRIGFPKSLSLPRTTPRRSSKSFNCI